jgi:hypothetical protein
VVSPDDQTACSWCWRRKGDPGVKPFKDALVSDGLPFNPSPSTERSPRPSSRRSPPPGVRASAGAIEELARQHAEGPRTPAPRRRAHAVRGRQGAAPVRRLRARAPPRRAHARAATRGGTHGGRARADGWTRSSRRGPPRSPPTSAGRLPPWRAMPRLWQAKTTTDRDRKELLCTLVREASVTMREPERPAELELVWAGGARSELSEAQFGACAAPALWTPNSSAARVAVAGEHRDHARSSALARHGRDLHTRVFRRCTNVNRHRNGQLRPRLGRHPA